MYFATAASNFACLRRSAASRIWSPRFSCSSRSTLALLLGVVGVGGMGWIGANADVFRKGLRAMGVCLSLFLFGIGLRTKIRPRLAVEGCYGKSDRSQGRGIRNPVPIVLYYQIYETVSTGAQIVPLLASPSKYKMPPLMPATSPPRPTTCHDISESIRHPWLALDSFRPRHPRTGKRCERTSLAPEKLLRMVVWHDHN